MNVHPSPNATALPTGYGFDRVPSVGGGGVGGSGSAGAGRQLVLVHVKAAYTGAGSAGFEAAFRLRAVGASSVSYSQFESGCGDIPDELTEAEVFSGGTITGTACWSIASSDAASLVLYDDPAENVPRRLFFALH